MLALQPPDHRSNGAAEREGSLRRGRHRDPPPGSSPRHEVERGDRLGQAGSDFLDHLWQEVRARCTAMGVYHLLEDRFFALAEHNYLRAETRDYVPKMIAAAETLSLDGG